MIIRRDPESEVSIEGQTAFLCPGFPHFSSSSSLLRYPFPLPKGRCFPILMLPFSSLFSFCSGPSFLFNL